MLCHHESRRSSNGVIARSGATKQSTNVENGLDCFASLAMTATGIGANRRDLALGRAVAGSCPAWQDKIPVFSVAIQLAACIFAVINRQATRIFARPSILDGGYFSKDGWRRSALRLRSGRGEMRMVGQCRREVCVILARRRTIEAASPPRRDPLSASGHRA